MDYPFWFDSNFTTAHTKLVIINIHVSIDTGISQVKSKSSKYSLEIGILTCAERKVPPYPIVGLASCLMSSSSSLLSVIVILLLHNVTYLKLNELKRIYSCVCLALSLRFSVYSFPILTLLAVTVTKLRLF